MVELISGTLSLIESIYANEGIDLHCKSLPKKEVYVYGDSGKIQQVLMNLLANARDATEGQKKRMIAIHFAECPDLVKISVEDNGSGIPEKVKDRIFETFFTTKPAGKGTGMGLGISLQIVKSLGGSLDFETNINKGTSFIVSIPRYFPREDIKKIIQCDSRPREKVQLADLAALVVEDEEEVRDILVSMLELLGVQKISTAENGAIALEKIKNQDFDVVFSDLRMPVMDGTAFLKKVRELPIKQPKLIAMTGGVTIDLENCDSEQLSGIIDGHLYKPYDINKLKNIVGNVFTALA